MPKLPALVLWTLRKKNLTYACLMSWQLVMKVLLVLIRIDLCNLCPCNFKKYFFVR